MMMAGNHERESIPNLNKLKPKFLTRLRSTGLFQDVDSCWLVTAGNLLQIDLLLQAFTSYLLPQL